MMFGPCRFSVIFSNVGLRQVKNPTQESPSLRAPDVPSLLQEPGEAALKGLLH